jgi:hypothetical protein
MKILVGSSAPQYHHHLLIINFQYHYVGCTAGDLEEEEEEEEEEELIETRLYEKGERREGRSCWLTMPFNVLSHQPEKREEQHNRLRACVYHGGPDMFLMQLLYFIYCCVCRAKDKRGETLRRRRCAGWGAGIFFVFQIEGHNEQQRRYRI